MKKFSTFILEADNIELNGFCILKPEFLEHEEDFLALLKNNGWKIVQKKKLLLTKEQSSNLYSPHKDKDFYKDLCDYMSSNECLCCSCQKLRKFLPKYPVLISYFYQRLQLKQGRYQRQPR